MMLDMDNGTIEVATMLTRMMISLNSEMGFRDLQTPQPGFDSTNYVPDVVKTFVVYLYRHIREKNVYEVHQMYEGNFQKLSEMLFKQSN